jgi:glycopeptide antibiotics resistance protein
VAHAKTRAITDPETPDAQDPRRRGGSGLGAASTVILIAYCALLIRILVFKDLPTMRVGHLMLSFGGRDGGHPANLVPLKTIVPYLRGNQGLLIAGVNLVGNVAALVPLGVLAPLVSPKITPRRSLALAVAAGLSLEILQAVLRTGTFDVDDVILNALGVMIGYWACAIAGTWARSKKYGRIAVAAVVIVAASVALYVVYPKDQPLRNFRQRPQRTDLCDGSSGTGKITHTASTDLVCKTSGAHIVHISKTRYALATPGGESLRRESRQPSANNVAAYPGSQDSSRLRARRDRDSRGILRPAPGGVLAPARPTAR